MKPKIVAYTNLPKEAKQYISESCELVSFRKVNDENRPLFLEELKNADGLVGADMKIGEELVADCTQLKVVSNITVGYDNLDIRTLTDKGIMATNTPGVLSDSVADLMIGLMLAVGRRISELDNYVKQGDWKASAGIKLFGLDLHHKKLGIIGMGGIGSEIAKRAKFGFSMDILYHNRSRTYEEEKKYDAVYCSLDELLKESDYVCLMTPLTKQTEKLIGTREFGLMKKDAIFVNGSRGKTVDEAALIEALQTGRIAGAGLDVFEIEPVRPDNPLLKMDNVVAVPHIGSATLETRHKMAMLAAENVVAGAHGRRPSCLINQELWMEKKRF
ncbi:MAG: 2-hydroxyacid dehydrogenase [Bacillus sp. (in: firmicutes)]